jgi:hypothetical protein
MATPNDARFRGRDVGEIDPKRAARLADVSEAAPRYVSTFRRAYGGKSLRAAVNAFCIECMGFDAAEVRTCTAPACPLWAYRPGRSRARVHAGSCQERGAA